MEGGAAIRVIPEGADLLRIHEGFPERYPHLLEGRGGEGWGYDILFAEPEDPMILPAGATAADCARFLATLDECASPAAADVVLDETLPFLYGHFLFLSYEFVTVLEPRLASLPLPADVPLAWLQGFAGAILRERHSGRAIVTGRDASVVARIASDLERLPATRPWPPVVLEYLDEDPPEDYEQGVRDIQARIIAGEIFQANLSRRYSGRIRTGTQAGALLEGLRGHNPAPFSAVARLGDTLIASASPERLVRCRRSQVMTQPIAGTCARGSGAAADESARRGLRTDPKERAEHLMLVDLERNDLGRVCVPGSVRVPELMRIESFATVHHLVSDVEGTLRADVRPSQLIRALFPGGSITGCPKIHCMEILAQNERRARGAYTGSLGYINERGDIDLNILIRTLVVRGSQIEFCVGAGIVADSDPKRELLETQAKAAGLMRALGAVRPH
ncbi:chorismate-binding protein [Acidiferrobacter sp.]|uniref:chorismate-binding protein n=1 Tax=Acidiferrobacter sp. TaxID=1872107 RepID=UPI00262065DA|nr:chorismate-binding protein [Acidiferrobacter sp.]